MVLVRVFSVYCADNACSYVVTYGYWVLLEVMTNLKISSNVYK